MAICKDLRLSRHALYGLSILGQHIPDYRRMGVEWVRKIHDPFVVRGRGVIWKMKKALSGSYPGYGSGARDVKYAFTNYGVSVGLQAVNAMPQRVQWRMNGGAKCNESNLTG